MPTIEQILNGPKEIANTWRAVAIVWHAYFATLAVILICRIRLSRRVFGILLGLPLLSISILAWTYTNPFNGTIFGLIGILVISVSTKLSRDNVQIAPLWAMVPGALIFIRLGLPSFP